MKFSVLVLATQFAYGYSSSCIYDPFRQVGSFEICPVPDVTTFYPQDIMDDLDSLFTIEINGSPISNISDDAELPAQAKVGTDAAVFSLKSGRLHCGDRVLGRAATEDRSLRPKKILWFASNSSEGKIKPVTAQPDGDSYQLTFAGALLTEKDGAIFADLLKEGESTVLVRLQ